jgi:glycosyltransferase involved in cell wall biosynthesis
VASVSIGIPVYNGAQFLATSLESLLAQTYEDIEFFISDNGSTDGTEEICREYAARDARIRYMRAETNNGASWNYRNVAHRTAGRYFKWATHDDLLAPTYIERCVEALERGDERVALVYPRTIIIDESGAHVREYIDNLDIRDRTPHERLGRLIRNIIMSNASFGLIRRSAIERSRLLDTFPSADYVMMAEFAMLGEFWEIPEFLFYRREHPGMSRAAHRTPAEAAEWFKPGSGVSRGKEVNESWRLFVEHLRSIGSMPMGRVERARCYGTFFPAWFRRHWRRTLAEPLGLDYYSSLRRRRSSARMT